MLYSADDSSIPGRIYCYARVIQETCNSSAAVINVLKSVIYHVKFSGVMSHSCTLGESLPDYYCIITTWMCCVGSTLKPPIVRRKVFSKSRFDNTFDEFGYESLQHISHPKSSNVLSNLDLLNTVLDRSLPSSISCWPCLLYTSDAADE